MRLLVALICCLMACALRAEEPAPAAPAANPLAGTSWAITIVSGEGEKTEDVITFEGDKMASQVYAEARFTPGPAKVSGKADSANVTANLAEPNGRELVLRGKVSGDSIEGTIAVGVRGQYERSTFSGKKK
jgi:hypothetical protein